MDAVTQTPAPKNETVLTYAPGSAERAELEGALKRLGQAEPVDLTVTVGGEQRPGGGEKIDVVQPHNHRHVLGTIHSATQQDTTDAITAAATVAPEWRALSYDDRAAILLRAADLLTGPWRATINAATMLGQSKTATQAEIDSACELADFWRFNVEFGRRVLTEQPISSPGVWNRLEHRPLEGFVYAITPFNFTAIMRQPADRARADGQHRAVEAVADAVVRRAPDHAAARRGRPARGRHQPAAG